MGLAEAPIRTRTSTVETPSVTFSWLYSAISHLKNKSATTLPDYGEAVVAIQSRDNSHSIKQNRFFKVFNELFTHEWKWKGQTVEISEDSYKDEESVQAVVEQVGRILRPLYEIADEILEADLPGITTHNFDNHIRSVSERFLEICQLAERVTKIKISPKDRLIGLLTVLFHDVAQGISGRTNHELIAAIITNQVLKGSGKGIEIVQSVCHFVETHATASYDYDANVDSLIYGCFMLADEAHIATDRMTEPGWLKLLSGNSDVWKKINGLCEKSFWGTDELGKPQWKMVLKVDSGLDRHNFILAYQKDDRVMEEVRKCKGDETKMKALMVEEYVNVFSLAVLCKLNLFKSAIKKIFGSADFSVVFLDAEGNQWDISDHREVVPSASIQGMRSIQ